MIGLTPSCACNWRRSGCVRRGGIEQALVGVCFPCCPSKHGPLLGEQTHSSGAALGPILYTISGNDTCSRISKSSRKSERAEG